MPARWGVRVGRLRPRTQKRAPHIVIAWLLRERNRANDQPHESQHHHDLRSHLNPPNQSTGAQALAPNPRNNVASETLALQSCLLIYDRSSLEILRALPRQRFAESSPTQTVSRRF